MHLDRKKQKQKKCQGSRMSTINRITNSADSRLKQNQTKCQAYTPLKKIFCRVSTELMYWKTSKIKKSMDFAHEIFQ